MKRWASALILAALVAPAGFGQDAPVVGRPTTDAVVAESLRFGGGRHAKDDYLQYRNNPRALEKHLPALHGGAEAGPTGIGVLGDALAALVQLTRGEGDWSQYVGPDQPGRVASRLDRRDPSAAANAAWIVCCQIGDAWERGMGRPALDHDLGQKLAESVCGLLGTGWGDEVARATLRTIGHPAVTPLLARLADADGRVVVSALDALSEQGYAGREVEVYAAAIRLRDDGRRLPGQRIDTVGRHADLLARQVDESRYVWEIERWPWVRLGLLAGGTVLAVAVLGRWLWRRRKHAEPVAAADPAAEPAGPLS